MALNLTTLFTRLGSIFGYLGDVNTWQNTTNADVAFIVSNYTTEEPLIDGIATAASGQLSSELGLMSYLQQVAINTINTMIFEVQPLASTSNLLASMQAVIAAMIAQAATVQSSTITSSVSPNLTNGNGTCIVTTQTNLGLSCQTLIPEIITVSCVQDSTAGATAGNELFQAAGQVAATNPLNYDYPIGSGSLQQLTAISGQTNMAGGNFLNNSSFTTDVMTPNVPDQWVLTTGIAGTTCFVVNSPLFEGTHSLKFVGTVGGENTELRQEFANVAGTTLTLNGITTYSVNLWAILTSATATGVLNIDLVRADAGTILQDNSGNNCSIAIPISGLNNSTWTSVGGSFSTPYLINEAEYLIRLRMSTPLASTKGLVMSNMALGAPTQMYPLGPSLTIFSGSNPFFIPDGFAVTTTNNFGGASNLEDFQTMFQRVFAMNGLGSGLLLPYSGSPSISNSLIATS